MTALPNIQWTDERWFEPTMCCIDRMAMSPPGGRGDVCARKTSHPTHPRVSRHLDLLYPTFHWAIHWATGRSLGRNVSVPPFIPPVGAPGAPLDDEAEAHAVMAPQSLINSS